MATLSFPQLSLNLPNSRMSVDFASFAVDLSAFSEPTPKPHNDRKLNRKPLPPVRQTVQHLAQSYQSLLPDVQEESEPPVLPVKQSKWSLRKTTPVPSNKVEQAVLPLTRTNSNASTVSTKSSALASVFSRTQSVSTAHTSYSYQPSEKLDTFPEEVLGLSSLPVSLVEHILSYALALPRTVSIGPGSEGHMKYRYNRDSLDYVDIRKLLRHPLFFVSQHIRHVALDVLYRKCEFAIDLSSIYYTKVSSTVNDNLKKHQKFWADPAPPIRGILRSLNKLHIRLPVPSTEAAVRRGRDEDDWMDGSDGKGGGSWRVKSMKREQEDALEVQKCLEVIMKLVMATRSTEPQSQGLTRSLSNLGSVRRSNSRSRAGRSKSAEYSGAQRGASPEGDPMEDEKRKPLKRLDIVLVKRSPEALVLAECLGLIRTLRGVPVTGYMRYYFELVGQKMLWATKYRKRWQGMEPDGARLLQDLQSLTVAEKPIEPIVTPTEFKFVKVNRSGQLHLLDSALPKTPILLEQPPVETKNLPEVPPIPSTPKTTILKPRGRALFGRRAHKRNDSFGFILDKGMNELGSSGTTTSGRNEPPSVEELQKIAEDIRKGLY